MPGQGSSLTSSEAHSNHEVPGEWEKANITHSFELGEKEGLVNCSLPNATSVPGKVTEQTLRGIAAERLKDEKGTARIYGGHITSTHLNAV
ncbi:hypothetical protein llap_10044 [Limosa lapponica baueri]|uniref:Uncharacterized protein n=1 Tax=Limosa lapponica baueri TaxID=1758121 RepID=A0A2I0U144_LIMLA|nr:hypothetical protein llap_10044 [Limosa lapponica baueri]